MKNQSTNHCFDSFTSLRWFTLPHVCIKSARNSYVKNVRMLKQKHKNQTNWKLKCVLLVSTGKLLRDFRTEDAKCRVKAISYKKNCRWVLRSCLSPSWTLVDLILSSLHNIFGFTPNFEIYGVKRLQIWGETFVLHLSHYYSCFTKSSPFKSLNLILRLAAKL